MANGTLTTGSNIDVSFLSALARDLNSLSRAASAVQKKLEALLPRVGSNNWWEKEIEQGAKSLKLGQGTVVESKKELKKFLAV